MGLCMAIAIMSTMQSVHAKIKYSTGGAIAKKTRMDKACE